MAATFERKQGSYERHRKYSSQNGFGVQVEKTTARKMTSYVYGEHLRIGSSSVRVRYIGTSRRLGCPLGLSMGSGELYCLGTGAKLGERVTRIPKVPIERSDDAAWRRWAASCFGAVASLGEEDQVAETVGWEALT